MNIDEARLWLERYIEEDVKINNEEPLSDFDQFCYDHIDALKTVLYELRIQRIMIRRMADVIMLEQKNRVQSESSWARKREQIIGKYRKASIDECDRT